MNYLMLNMYTNTYIVAAASPITKLWRKTPLGKKTHQIELFIMGALALWAIYGIAMFIKYPKKGIKEAILPTVLAFIYYTMFIS